MNAEPGMPPGTMAKQNVCLCADVFDMRTTHRVCSFLSTNIPNNIINAHHKCIVRIQLAYVLPNKYIILLYFEIVAKN